jgi:hypothetical protein
LYPSIAAIGATYGDPNGKYASFLAQANNQYPAEPYFFWDQPFSDSNLAAATPVAPGQPSATSQSHSGALMSSRASLIAVSLIVLVSSLLY